MFALSPHHHITSDIEILYQHDVDEPLLQQGKGQKSVRGISELIDIINEK
tara:strand:- start:2027 stop:2176 length:150 start_codon:yes stop_codon:yes gene_type:complete